MKLLSPTQSPIKYFTYLREPACLTRRCKQRILSDIVDANKQNENEDQNKGIQFDDRQKWAKKIKTRKTIPGTNETIWPSMVMRHS